MNFLDSRLPERFWNKCIPEPNGGCWLWVGGLRGHGYGVVGSRRAMKRWSVQAHRMSYEALIGPIPHGLELDHRCSVSCCVNPAHLDPVTHRENVRRGQVGRTTAIRQSSKRYCPIGHPYDQENTYWQGHRRSCRACRHARNRARAAKRRVE